MHIPRRPAWPVAFLLAAGLASASGPPEALLNEIGRWNRLRAPGDAAAMQAFHESYAARTALWVGRWPGQELAWRQRLRALDAAEGSRDETMAALEGAERTLGSSPGLRYPESTLWLMARVAVRGGVRLHDVETWLETALTDAERELPAGSHPLIQAYRKERLSHARWRAATIRAERAYLGGDTAALRDLWVVLTAESALPVLDPADRVAAAERARRRMEAFLWKARLARLEGDPAEAKRRYAQALAARPTSPGWPEPAANLALIEESALDPGQGAPLPPADRAGPHWLPTVWPTAETAGPWIAVVWDGDDPRQARALERLSRRQVRVFSRTGWSAAQIREINPLYAAPQVWIADAAGVIRLVGRFQPGGDGWEEAVAGAALRLASR